MVTPAVELGVSSAVEAAVEPDVVLGDPGVSRGPEDDVAAKAAPPVRTVVPITAASRSERFLVSMQ
ncbi:MAG TPA: hypothetical protein VF855_12040 [Acidimicrobiales bacterium]